MGAIVNAIGDDDVKMRVEVEGRAPSLCEADDAGLWSEVFDDGSFLGIERLDL